MSSLALRLPLGGGLKILVGGKKLVLPKLSPYCEIVALHLILQHLSNTLYIVEGMPSFFWAQTLFKNRRNCIRLREFIGGDPGWNPRVYAEPARDGWDK